MPRSIDTSMSSIPTIIKVALIIFSTIITVISTVPTIVLLVLGSQKNETCDMPLQTYLIVHAVKIIPMLAAVILGIVLFSGSGERRGKFNTLMSLIFISLVVMFHTGWFIYGSYLVFSPSNCRAEAPIYYWGSLVLTAIEYVYTALPLAFAILCLPCLYIFGCMTTISDMDY